MIRGIAFLSGPRPLDYGSRIARLRWRRAAGAGRVVEWAPYTPAAPGLAGADFWVLVRDAEALPGGRVPDPAPGGVLRSSRAALPPVHTLRELEQTGLAPDTDLSVPAAIAFRTADHPARPQETAEELFERLTRIAAPGEGFVAAPFEDSSERERPELTGRLPRGALRVLDAGCGAGGGIALAKARNLRWTVTGIERDPLLASRARRLCDRVLEGDLADILPRLEAGAERFDALVFADVLEHLDDPVTALAAARRLAAPQATLLVSVPNAGHLSVARDLLAGRFDPVPAGLCDAGHLRWFTRAFLADVLAESGWTGVRIEGEPGAPPPEPEPFLVLSAHWPDADRDSLLTYQWIATAHA
ncbi:MAG: methyltransferase domain-containing protein [Thermoanaerobaculia bacterium]